MCFAAQLSRLRLHQFGQDERLAASRGGLLGSCIASGAPGGRISSGRSATERNRAFDVVTLGLPVGQVSSVTRDPARDADHGTV